MTRSILLVAIDFSPPSEAALAWALAFGHGREHAIHLIHVVEDLPGLPPARQRSEAETVLLAESVLAQLGRLAPEAHASIAPLMQHVRRGQPVRQILTCARDLGAELLVVGSHGHTGLERLLVGSVAERLVRLAECPVVVVKDQARVRALR